MPEVNGPNPGHFAWIELATSDPDAAKKFYSDVFGWFAKENDMGDFGVYYIFQKNDRDVAAMYKLMPEQTKAGVPPNWLSYVGLANADDAAAKARELGATIMQPVFDVMDFGRMAVIQDPQGAVFAIWESKKHWGVTIRDEANTLCWNELATRDAAAARDFYSKLFGWTFKVSEQYSEIYIGETGIGGVRTLNEGEQAPPNWMPYFMADSVDATTAKAQGAGATVYVPPGDIPGTGRFSVLADPQGAVFALYQPAAK